MLRLVAVDLDDTLLKPDGTISERVATAVRSVRQRGVWVTLATGRMYRSAVPFAEQLGLELPLITYQGALIKMSATGEVIRRLTIDRDIAVPLLEFLEDHDVHINLYLDDSLYVAEMNETAERYALYSRVPVEAVGRLSCFPLQQVTKVVVIADPLYLRYELRPKAEQLFKGSLTINNSRPHFLEFGHLLATKSDALAHLIERQGITRQEVMAIGDGENDLDMLEFAGVGVAMGNAAEEAKAAADYITASNDEDGVALALERFILTSQVNLPDEKGGPIR